jgi:hypothetical protein
VIRHERRRLLNVARVVDLCRLAESRLTPATAVRRRSLVVVAKGGEDRAPLGVVGRREDLDGHEPEG